MLNDVVFVTPPYVYEREIVMLPKVESSLGLNVWPAVTPVIVKSVKPITSLLSLSKFALTTNPFKEKISP